MSTLATPETMADMIQAHGLKHIAMIMDGNRRWAESRHLPKTLGHQQGVESLKTMVRYCSDLGLEALTVYAFSTENWSRGKDEVGFLMKLFIQALQREIQDLHANQVRIQFMGDLSALPNDLQDSLSRAMALTANNPGLKFQVATNYGSRAELVHAFQELARRVQSGELSPEEVTESHVQQALYTAELPDPDLIIRTGGESRLSNFLLWQAAYAELYWTETLWPDFSKALLNDAIEEFCHRHRRYGE